MIFLLLIAQIVMPSRVNQARVATTRDLTVLIGTPYVHPPQARHTVGGYYAADPTSRMLPYGMAIHPRRIVYSDGRTLRLWGPGDITVTAPEGNWPYTIMADWQGGIGGICGAARRPCGPTWRMFTWTGERWVAL